MKCFEKLKINPLDFNDLKISYKSDLKTFDIVKMNGKKYMVFKNNDFSKLNHMYDEMPSIDEGIFFYYDNSAWCETHYMKIKSYNENLKIYDDLSFVINNSWDVTDIYTHPKFFNEPKTIKQITQEFMNDSIAKYNYKHICIS